MSEAPKSWRIADGVRPNEKWNRPERIQLVTDSLSTKGATDIEVHLGGERFMFTYHDKFVVLDIRTGGRGKKQNAAVFAHVFASRDEWDQFINNPKAGGRQQFQEYLQDADSEEKIRDGVDAVLGQF